MSKNLEILAIQQMGRMATPPVTSAKLIRQTTYTPVDPKTMEYASKFLNWFISTQYKDIDVDIALAALDSIGKLRSKYSVDPLLAFLKYYQDLQGQLSQQAQQVNQQQLAQMQQQAAQAKAAKAAPAQPPKTTTTTTTTGGGENIDAEKASIAKEFGIGNSAADYNNYVKQNRGALDEIGMGGLADDVLNANGTGAPTTTTTTTTTGGSLGGGASGTSSGSAPPSAAGLTQSTGQTYAQMYPQLDDRCKKLIPATTNSLKSVTKQNYYMHADWNKWWDLNKTKWQP